VVAEIPAHRVRFELPLADHPRIDYFVKNFSGPGAYDFQRRLERSGRYVPLMKKIFAEEGLPEDLVYLALIESGFIEHAYSWARAVGPWQFIEGTGRIYGLDNDWWHDERRDPVKSTRAAALHLKKLYARFGDWYLAAAAYNAGAGTIQRAIRKTGSRDFFELARRKCLRAETRNYVPKFIAALKIVREPEAYGFHNLKYLAPLEFDTVTVPTSTDLEVIARLCGTDYKKIKHLNPELKRWCTPPGKSKYNVKIPSGLGATFEKKYAGLPVNERARFKRHQIRSGDTLGGLARRYNIRVRDIKVLNSIDNPRALQIGDNLILPMQDGYNRLPLDELQDDYKRSRRKTYRVRKGDSLWTIARRFDVSEKELRVWNRLGWSNTIRPGQRLVVSTKAASSRRSPAAKGRYQVEYTVAGGDTLWDIGREFGVSAQDIRGWNNLAGNQVLHPGDKLTLHVNDLSRGRGLSPPSTSPAAADESRKEVYYQVRSGDSLWAISRKFGITTGAVQNWNGFSSGHVLRPGDRLLLKVPASLQSPLLTAAVPAKSPPSGPQPGGPLQKVVYQVRSGDTLWDIGQQFNVATRKIRHWNNLSERHVLRPGDKLTLHVAVDEKG
jgi:membrane-bound lytic murein transglycosylase D